MSELGSIDNPVKFKDQDYDALLQKCLKTAALFSDTVFAANQSSLGIPVDPDPKKGVKWLRPKEITSNAVFVEGTMGTTDICQGQLGNCWLLAALSCLTMHPQLFVKVVPSGQSLSESYAGIFRFRAASVKEIGTVTSEGLVKGHAYAITDTDKFQMVLSEKDVDDYDYGEDEDVEEEDGEDDVVVAPVSKTEKQREKKKKCTVLVELLQKYRRQKDQVNFLYIAFHIYKVPLEMVMSKPVLPEDQFRVQKWFDEKAGSDDRVNAVQFMNLVNSVLEKDYELPLETCRQLIFGEDTGGRGRLSRAQAEKLLTSLRNLQSIFFQFDEDSSGTMSPFELSLALNAAGVECDNVVVQLLWERFGAGEQYLPFNGFVSCVARLQVLF
ncbi:hypothetical protein cypCar_00036665, partial [Cyprinus carpio]